MILGYFNDVERFEIAGATVGIVTRSRAGRPGFFSRRGAKMSYFSLPHRVQKGSGAHLASDTMSTGSSFPGGKVARA